MATTPTVRAPTGEWWQKTVRVDSFRASPRGLYNVHGNVWDWTEDCWNDKNSRNPGDDRARTTGDCGNRIVNQGSWADSPHHFSAPPSATGTNPITETAARASALPEDFEVSLRRLRFQFRDEERKSRHL